MSLSQLPMILTSPLTNLKRASDRFLRSRSLLIAMALLQLLWLAAVVLTGASTRYDTIFVVAVFSIVATGIVIYVPARVVGKLRTLKDWLLYSEMRVFYVLGGTGLLVGFVYALCQHMWGDEGSSFQAANIIYRDGLAAAYREVGWLGEQHPPLFSLIFGLTLYLPGPDLFYMRMVSVVFLMCTLWAIYLLGRELYGRETGLLAAILLLAFPLVIRISAAAMLDMQLTFFFSFALLLIHLLAKKPSYRLACAAGFVVGLGLLTKYIMVLIFPVLFLYVWLIPNFRRIISYLIVLSTVAAAGFAIWLLYAHQLDILSIQFQKILKYTGSYHVVHNIGEDLQLSAVQASEEEEEMQDLLQSGILRLGLESLFTRIPSALGVHHAPVILFGLLLLIRSRTPVSLFLLLWIGVVSVSLFLTLPDHRYFLPIFPALAIAAARVFSRFPQQAERAILFSLLLAAANLFLFANWVRESHLFILPS